MQSDINIMVEDLSDKTVINKCEYFIHEYVSETEVRIKVDYTDKTLSLDKIINIEDFTREKVRELANEHYENNKV